MKCQTIKYIKKDGTAVIANKVKYSTLAEADLNAGLINNKDKTLTKRVSYKCIKCGFYHVGTSLKSLNKPITSKKPKLFGGTFKLPKIIGMIDLSIFNKTPKIKEVIAVIEEPTKLKTDWNGKLYVDGLVWKYEAKVKLVKVFSPSGQVYKPSMEKIFGDGERTSNAIKRYIKNQIEKINYK